MFLGKMRRHDFFLGDVSLGMMIQSFPFVCRTSLLPSFTTMIASLFPHRDGNKEVQICGHVMSLMSPFSTYSL